MASDDAQGLKTTALDEIRRALVPLLTAKPHYPGAGR